MKFHNNTTIITSASAMCLQVFLTVKAVWESDLSFL